MGFSVILVFFIIYSYWQKQKFEDLTDCMFLVQVFFYLLSYAFE